MNKHVTGGVVHYSFPSLDPWRELSHAAFSRIGGVSEPPFESLNISFVVNDDEERVRENRRRMADTLGWDSRRMVTAYQVHGSKVTAVGRDSLGGPDAPDTDVLATDEPGVLLFLKFADCVPVVLWDPVRRAVAIAHSGWRGTVQATPAAAVSFMVERYGSRPEQMLAAIGPSIGPCCYEVGPDVASRAAKAFSGASVLLRTQEGSVRLDLWSANAETLMRAGIPEENVEVAGVCTSCRHDEFYSHRASGGRTGRFAVAVGIVDG